MESTANMQKGTWLRRMTRADFRQIEINGSVNVIIKNGAELETLRAQANKMNALMDEGFFSVNYHRDNGSARVTHTASRPVKV